MIIITISEQALLKKVAVIRWGGQKKKKELLLFATKLTKKILDPTKGREQYKLFLKDENKKIPKAPKTVKNPKNGSKTSVSLRQPKTTSNLLKLIMQSNIISEEAETYKNPCLLT